MEIHKKIRKFTIFVCKNTKIFTSLNDKPKSKILLGWSKIYVIYERSFNDLFTFHGPTSDLRLCKPSSSTDGLTSSRMGPSKLLHPRPNKMCATADVIIKSFCLFRKSKIGSTRDFWPPKPAYNLVDLALLRPGGSFLSLATFLYWKFFSRLCVCFFFVEIKPVDDIHPNTERGETWLECHQKSSLKKLTSESRRFTRVI